MENKILNLGILAHVDAGKTTLTEGILYHSNVVASMGKVDKGTTVTDFLALERARGMTIKASTVSFIREDVKINLIDTPGHADFIGEVERSLRVLDGAVLVISAVEGVQPQTRILFRYLKRMKIPTLLFINKIDRMGADYERTCKQIRELLSKRLVLMQEVEEQGRQGCRVRNYSFDEVVWREQIIACSERLLEKYLAGKQIEVEALKAYLRFWVGKGRLYPVYAGSALQDCGIQALMDGIVAWLPAVSAKVASPKPLSAYVYKVEFDEQGHKKIWFRVFAGTLFQKARVSLQGGKEEIVIHNLLGVTGAKQMPVERIKEGDIGILRDVGQVKCGDFLGESRPGKGWKDWGEPMLQVGVRPPEENKRRRLLEVLTLLEYEDPLLRVAINERTREICVRLFGRLQLEILSAQLAERFGPGLVYTGVRTVQKAKPIRAVDAQIRMWEPGNLHHAGIALSLAPLETGQGNRYETRVSFGYLEKSFQNAVQEGVEKALEEGLGESIVDTSVILTEADYDSVNSTPADYRRLAPAVVKQALLAAGLVKLEPYMSYRLLAPTSLEKRVMAALGKLSASVESVVFTGEEMEARGQVAYDIAKEFPVDLRTMTGGQGIFEMTFLEYRRVNAVHFDG